MFIAQEPQMPSRHERRSDRVGIDLVFDLQQRIEHHRSALVHIDLIAIHARARARGGIEAVDAKRAHLLRAGRGRIVLAGALVDAGVGRQREFSHVQFAL